MPEIVAPYVPHYQAPPPTTQDLEWADIPVVDFSSIHIPERRAELAVQVRDALTTSGFFYIINHGYTPEQTARMFDIADVPFEQVTAEEKKNYVATMKQTGSYQGYKPRQYWHIDNGVKDQLEHYNINREVNKRSHPKAVQPFLPEISAFAKHNHLNILYPILQLVARGLELPENTFVDKSGFDSIGETYVRFMKYYPRSEDEESKTGNVWLRGHTDFGSVTILWSQPVSALQILSPDRKWRWIKHIENALVINAGDCLEFLSGGFYRATIHRVRQPPQDQRNITRLGVFYFCIPDDDVKLEPVMDSPVLQRIGIEDRFRRHDVEPVTVAEWRKVRTAAYGTTELKEGEQAGVQVEMLNGVEVRHYD